MRKKKDVLLIAMGAETEITETGQYREAVYDETALCADCGQRGAYVWGWIRICRQCADKEIEEEQEIFRKYINKPGVGCSSGQTGSETKTQTGATNTT